MTKSFSTTPEGFRYQYNRVRYAALSLVGLVCKHCDNKDLRVLQIDHVKGNGQEERRKHRGASLYYFIIREVLAGRKRKYQTLCANCNVIKRLKNQECPRKELT